MRPILLSLMLLSASALAVDYSDPEAWLCRPDYPNACAADQTATIVNADGSTQVEAFSLNEDADIDCFSREIDTRRTR